MKAILSLLLLLALTFVSAADLTVIGPKEGAQVSAGDSFSFSIGSSAIIKSCQLIVDDQVLRTSQYGEQMRGRSLSYTIVVEDGAHTWSVKCATDNGTIYSTPTQSITYVSQLSDVKVFSNGVKRGSLTHQFKFENSLEQHPINVPDVAAGDYVEILLSIPPSTVKKELYVKQVSVKNTTRVMNLEDYKKNEDYSVIEGRNATITIGQTKIILHFKGMQGNKPALVFYPTVKTETPEDPVPVETPVDAPVETPEPTPVTEPTSAPPAAPKQGIIKRFFSWLGRLFGG